jgi:hypothetical protein
MRNGWWKPSTNHRGGNFEEGFSKHFQTSKYSILKEVNKTKYLKAYKTAILNLENRLRKY